MGAVSHVTEFIT